MAGLQPICRWGYCLSCVIFAKSAQRSNLGILVNKPFTKWHKKSEILTQHTTKQYHHDSWQLSRSFLEQMKDPSLSVKCLITPNVKKNYENNYKILSCCVEAILFCGRQCIAFRTRNEQSDSGNPGNFIAFLRAMADHDSVLQEHLISPKYKNATYTSPHTENELIEIIGKDFIQSSLLDEIKEAKHFTIMAEVESHHAEICSLCIRYQK
ncbi:Uncharacterised protein at_DN2034 [Pycnogonum litorale]